MLGTRGVDPCSPASDRDAGMAAPLARNITKNVNLKIALAATQPLQDRGRSEPVWHLSHRGLELAQRAAGPAAEAAVGLAHLVAARAQVLLQLVTFLAGKDAFVPRPRLHEMLPAAQSVREMADGKRVGLGRVVFHDDAEILQHQKTRALRPRRHQQIGAVLRARECLATGAPRSEEHT